MGLQLREKDIENAMLAYLDLIAHGQFWKVDVGGVFDSTKGVFRKRQSKFNYKGVPDIIGFYKGFFVGIEVKTPKRKSSATEEQKKFGEVAIANGQFWIVATSLTDIVKLIKDINQFTLG